MRPRRLHTDRLNTGLLGNILGKVRIADETSGQGANPPALLGQGLDVFAGWRGHGCLGGIDLASGNQRKEIAIDP